ncbi:hypothetical protein Celaphus_00004033 [Cervus elaphus hippelaphus]|uniref:Uncharacterized protein n=1 Tax=Cervus elaphus hippelaphus TaxID=46360 RepID=A0A212DDJ1_CEREH|nr:hypothetical protein Celaphus_00004033 [Cervus elaphus hippelaphus]
MSQGAPGGPADSRSFFGPGCHRGGRLAAPGQRHPGPVRPAGAGDRPHRCGPGGSSLREVHRARGSCRCGHAWAFLPRTFFREEGG